MKRIFNPAEDNLGKKFEKIKGDGVNKPFEELLRGELPLKKNFKELAIFAELNHDLTLFIGGNVGVANVMEKYNCPLPDVLNVTFQQTRNESSVLLRFKSYKEKGARQSDVMYCRVTRKNDTGRVSFESSLVGQPNSVANAIVPELASSMLQELRAFDQNKWGRLGLDFEVFPSESEKKSNTKGFGEGVGSDYPTDAQIIQDWNRLAGVASAQSMIRMYRAEKERAARSKSKSVVTGSSNDFSPLRVDNSAFTGSLVCIGEYGCVATSETVGHALYGKPYDNGPLNPNLVARLRNGELPAEEMSRLLESTGTLDFLRTSRQVLMQDKGVIRLVHVAHNDQASKSLQAAEIRRIIDERMRVLAIENASKKAKLIKKT